MIRPLAEAEPVGTFRRRLRALIETVRSTTLSERYEDAARGRRVVLQPDHDAMTWVMTLMPAVEAQAIWGRATRIAKVILAEEGETVTVGQVIARMTTDAGAAGAPTAPTNGNSAAASSAVSV